MPCARCSHRSEPDGSIVVADRDGVVVVPRERAAEVAVALADVIKFEAVTERAVKSGKKKKFWDAEQFAARGVEIVD